MGSIGLTYWHQAGLTVGLYFLQITCSVVNSGGR